MSTYVYDIESYPNYFLCVFKPLGEESYVSFTIKARDELVKFLDQSDLVLIGYNNLKFDDTLLKLILVKAAHTAKELFDFGQEIIKAGKEGRWLEGKLQQAQQLSGLWRPIDLFQIMGGKEDKVGPLKVHQVRIKWKNVQDLPYHFETDVDAEQIKVIEKYCKNDVASTEALYHHIKGEVDTRYIVEEVYPFLKGKATAMSEPQIAERVIRAELEKRCHSISCKVIQRQKEDYEFLFNPAERIHPDIHFELEHNQATLNRIRKLTPFVPQLWTEREKNEEKAEKEPGGIGKHYPMIVGDNIIIKPGRGGLHTDLPPVICTSDSLIYVDVASYYPSLLLKFGKPPCDVPEEWMNIVRGLTTERVTAKYEGRKAEADVLKIVINSIYGKLNSKYSINYDSNLQLEVTLNGQLYLIVLIERFLGAGCTLLSANTDGITVNAKDTDVAIGIARQWAQEIGFGLDIEQPDIYVAEDVNNYAMHFANKGWLRKKGRFTRGRKATLPVVVYDAVLAQIEAGQAVGDYICNCGDIFNFLYSQKSSGVVSYDGKPTQKTNRWYIAKDGPALKRGTSNISNAEHCRVVNFLAKSSIPADLNLSHYIRRAQRVYERLVNGIVDPDIDPKELIAKAEKARALGFVAVPKGREGAEKASIPNTYAPDVIRRWRGEPLEDDIWERYQGVGVYTGSDVGVVGIDIDDVEQACASGLIKYIPTTGGVVAHHGKGSAKDVRTGVKRGTVLFRYSSDDIRKTSGAFLKQYGFEILYGSSVVQVAGYHPSGDKYTFSGKLADLPHKLRVWLMWELPEVKEPASEHYVSREYPPMTDEYRKQILDALRGIDLGNYNQWYLAGVAMHQSGFSLQDFIYVSESPDDCATQWEHIRRDKKHSVSFGYIVNLLKQSGIYVKGPGKKYDKLCKQRAVMVKRLAVLRDKPHAAGKGVSR